MFSDLNVVCYCTITIVGVATPSKHWPLNIFKLLLVPEAYVVALSRCRVVVVAKLYNCRCPAIANSERADERWGTSAQQLLFHSLFHWNYNADENWKKWKNEKRNFWRRKHRHKISRARPELESVKKITLISKNYFFIELDHRDRLPHTMWISSKT